MLLRSVFAPHLALVAAPEVSSDPKDDTAHPHNLPERLPKVR